MDLASVIAQARELQEHVFTDTVVLESEGEPAVVDDLGTVDRPWPEVYAGIGLVQAAAEQDRLVDSAGHPITVLPYVGKLPWAIVLADGRRHRVRVTASLDPANVGTYMVDADETQGWATCRRLRLSRV